MERGMPWDATVNKLHQLFPEYPKNKFKPFIEKVLREVKACDVESREEYYQQVINFNSIGPHADSVGLTRDKLNNFDIQPFANDKLTNGLLLDLDKYCDGLDHLWTILQNLSISQFKNKNILREHLQLIKKQYQKKNKSRSKNDQAQQYLKQQVSTSSSSSSCSKKRKFSQVWIRLLYMF